MGRPSLEVADIFRAHGPAWRTAQRGHLSLGQLKVMSAIEQCRSAALGGHVLRCGGCGTDQVAYNSCRNRHCPKCQSSAAQRWLDARQADLLPVEYYHLVFTLPAPIADIAYQNKAVVYGLLFDLAAEALSTIAADPKHLGARIGATLVLHTWGSAMTHHPHVHGIVPGGGLAPDGRSWVPCRPGFFLPVRVLSRLFRRRFLEELARVHQCGMLQFFGDSPRWPIPRPSGPGSCRCASASGSSMPSARSPDRRPCWHTCRATPTGWRSRTAGCWRSTRTTSPSSWKDYRVKEGSRGKSRHKTMTLGADEFMRRFLLHVLPGGFHRIRHYGLLANGSRKASLALARTLLGEPREAPIAAADATNGIDHGRPSFVCGHCGAAMIIVQTFARGESIRAPPRSG